MYAPEPAAIATPIGLVRIAGDAAQLTGITIDPAGGRETQGEGAAAREAAAQLRAYFDRRLDRFDLPLAPARTPRGQVLRAAMCDLGRGETLTYGALAARIGSAARAIGQACARNPFPIVVPCHRVLSGAGGRANYSAGAGVETKRWLLAHEGDDAWG